MFPIQTSSPANTVRHNSILYVWKLQRDVPHAVPFIMTVRLPDITWLTIRGDELGFSSSKPGTPLILWNISTGQCREIVLLPQPGTLLLHPFKPVIAVLIPGKHPYAHLGGTLSGSTAFGFDGNEVFCALEWESPNNRAIKLFGRTWYQHNPADDSPAVENHIFYNGKVYQLSGVRFNYCVDTADVHPDCDSYVACMWKGVCVSLNPNSPSYLLVWMSERC